MVGRLSCNVAVGTVLIPIFVGLALINEELAIRGIGLVLGGWGIRTLVVRCVGVGIEGHKPALQLDGLPAILIGLLGIVLGASIALAPELISGLSARY